MPVALRERAFKSWLSSGVKSPDDVTAMIAYAREDFEFYPATMQLNATEHGNEEFVLPVW